LLQNGAVGSKIICALFIGDGPTVTGTRKVSVGVLLLSQAITVPMSPLAVSPGIISTHNFHFNLFISNMASSLNNRTIVQRVSRDVASAQQRFVTLAGQANLSDNQVINYTASAYFFMDSIDTVMGSINTGRPVAQSQGTAEAAAAEQEEGEENRPQLPQADANADANTDAERDINTDRSVAQSQGTAEETTAAAKRAVRGWGEDAQADTANADMQEAAAAATGHASTAAKHAEQEEREEDSRSQADTIADANTDAKRTKAGSAVQFVEYARDEVVAEQNRTSARTGGLNGCYFAEEEKGGEPSGDAHEANAERRAEPRTSPRISAKRKLAEDKAEFRANIVSIGKTGNRRMPAAANESTAGADTASSPSDNNNDLSSPVAAPADVEMASGSSDVSAMEREVQDSKIQGINFVRLQDVKLEHGIEYIDNVPIGDRNRPNVPRPGWRRFPKKYHRQRNGPRKGELYRTVYHFAGPTIYRSGPNACDEYVLVVNTKPKVELFDALESEAKGNTAAALNKFLKIFKKHLANQSLANQSSASGNKKLRRETPLPAPIHIPVPAVAETAPANVQEQPQLASPSPNNTPAVARAEDDPLNLLLPDLPDLSDLPDLPQVEPSPRPINGTDELDLFCRSPIQDETLEDLFFDSATSRRV
jgi:hypothetical protein